MLYLRPKGRGYWALLEMRIEGRHLAGLLIQPGTLIQLAGATFRVVRVEP